MASISLLAKDLREHRGAAFLLAFGCLVIVLLSLAQNRAAAYSMSPFEIVRFALISFLPLIALITGNRLIVREYLSGTRLFVEALPIGTNLPLVLKYLLGFLYLGVLAGVIVLLAARLAGIADDVTGSYVVLILGKTLVMVSLYWSVVFCFSLCGYLRVALYLLAAALVALIAFFPGIDASRFPPFSLMNDQLFVFERDIIPWRDIIGTGVMSLCFTVAGFFLVRVGEGSVVERLAKPMTRRDYVALGVLAASGLAIWSTLVERTQRTPFSFSSDAVLHFRDPAVSVLYLEPRYQAAADVIGERTNRYLLALQAALGLDEIPPVRLSLAPDRDKHDIDYATLDGVLIKANWLEHDDFDDAILDSVVTHGVMSAQTNGRAVFEPYHWVLDGFTRWWVEQGQAPLRDEHRVELVARALWVLKQEPQSYRLIDHWQLTADRFSYPSAESLAWAAMSYLEQIKGRDTVLTLARAILTRDIGTTVFASLKDRRLSSRQRFERATGLALAEFHAGWQQWLRDQENDPAVIAKMQSIPALNATVISDTDEAGVHRLVASYHLDSDWRNYTGMLVPSENGTGSGAEFVGRLEQGGKCVMKHDYLGPFDTEFEVSDDNEDIEDCKVGEAVHVINSLYAPGDRVFIALDFEGSVFHQPLRLFAGRLTVQ